MAANDAPSLIVINIPEFTRQGEKTSDWRYRRISSHTDFETKLGKISDLLAKTKWVKLSPQPALRFQFIDECWDVVNGAACK